MTTPTAPGYTTPPQCSSSASSPFMLGNRRPFFRRTPGRRMNRSSSNTRSRNFSDWPMALAFLLAAGGMGHAQPSVSFEHVVTVVIEQNTLLQIGLRSSVGTIPPTSGSSMSEELPIPVTSLTARSLTRRPLNFGSNTHCGPSDHRVRQRRIQEPGGGNLQVLDFTDTVNWPANLSVGQQGMLRLPDDYVPIRAAGSDSVLEARMPGRVTAGWPWLPRESWRGTRSESTEQLRPASGDVFDVVASRSRSGALVSITTSGLDPLYLAADYLPTGVHLQACQKASVNSRQKPGQMGLDITLCGEPGETWIVEHSDDLVTWRAGNRERRRRREPRPARRTLRHRRPVRRVLSVAPPVRHRP